MLLFFAWPVALVVVLYQRYTSKHAINLAEDWKPEVFAVTRAHLLEPLTLTDIEYREMVDDPLGAAPKKPFGHFNGKWEQFKKLIEPSDALWSFKAKWGNHDRTAILKEGYALLEGDVVKSFFIKRIAPFKYVKERRSFKKTSLVQRMKEASLAR